MRRQILSLVAALLVAGPLFGSEAIAKDQHGRWEQRGGGHERGPDRGYERRGGTWRADDRGPPVRNRGDRGRGRDRRDDPRWERPPEAPDARYGVRRGGYLPPEGGAVIEDHARYRLRTPPRGYSWVRVPGGYALVSERTGQIFDMVPAP